MIKVIIFYCILILFFVESGCTSYHSAVRSDYQGKRLVPKILAIFVEPPIVLNPDEVIKNLEKKSPIDVYQNYLRQLFPQSMKSLSRSDSVIIIENKARMMLIDTVLTLDNKESIRVRLPRIGDHIEVDSVSVDYILFLNKLLILQNPGSDGNKRGMAIYFYDDPAIVHRGQYVFWDNIKGQAITYGRIELGSDVFSAVDIEMWQKYFDKLAWNILNRSPFVRSDIKRLD